MILVVAEHQGGQVHRASWEAIAAAQRLGSPVTVLVPGHGVGAIAAALAGSQVAQVIAVDDAGLADYTADGYVAALAEVIGGLSPSPSSASL